MDSLSDISLFEIPSSPMSREYYNGPDSSLMLPSSTLSAAVQFQSVHRAPLGDVRVQKETMRYLQDPTTSSTVVTKSRAEKCRYKMSLQNLLSPNSLIGSPALNMYPLRPEFLPCVQSQYVLRPLLNKADPRNERLLPKTNTACRVERLRTLPKPSSESCRKDARPQAHANAPAQTQRTGKKAKPAKANGHKESKRGAGISSPCVNYFVYSNSKHEQSYADFQDLHENGSHPFFPDRSPSSESAATSNVSLDVQSIVEPKAKRPWTEREDALLRQLVAKLGAGLWAAIAAQIPERTGKQVRERWLNHLSPGVTKRPWSTEEDHIIIESHRRLGNCWSRIAKFLNGRSDNSVKNRFYVTLRRRISSTASPTSGSAALACGVNQQTPVQSTLGKRPAPPNDLLDRPRVCTQPRKQHRVWE